MCTGSGSPGLLSASARKRWMSRWWGSSRGMSAAGTTLPTAASDQRRARLGPFFFVRPPSKSIQRRDNVGCRSVYHDRHEWTPGFPDVVHPGAQSGGLGPGPTLRNAGCIAQIGGPTSKMHSQCVGIHQELTARLAKSPAAQQAEIRVLPGVVQFANTHIKSCAHQYPKIMKHFSDGRRAAAPGAEHDN